jgi:aquaporin Z
MSETGDSLPLDPPPPTLVRMFGAEAVGTCVLLLIGPGSAIIASDKIGNAGVSLAFGFALLAMAYTIGHVSGCHINPAVTLSFFLTKKMSIQTAIYYWVGQMLGALAGGLLLYVITEGDDKNLDQTGIFAANGWGAKIGSQYGLGSVVVVEIFFTALLVFVVLSTTTRGYLVGFGGLAVGITLGMIHLATIPVDNTSVNPARSFGTAVFSGTDALSQLWAFIVFPLIGSVVGVLVWLMVHNAKLEDTLLNSAAARKARDTLD